MEQVAPMKAQTFTIKGRLIGVNDYVDEYSDPRDLMSNALDWIDLNRSHWQDFVSMCRYDAATCGRVRVKRAIEDLRGVTLTRQDGSPFRLPNAYSAPFGRILAAWYPELASAIPMSHSKVDGVVVPPRPVWLEAA